MLKAFRTATTAQTNAKADNTPITIVAVGVSESSFLLGVYGYKL